MNKQAHKPAYKMMEKVQPRLSRTVLPQLRRLLIMPTVRSVTE